MSVLFPQDRALATSPQHTANGQALVERMCTGCHSISGETTKVIEGRIAKSFGAISVLPQYSRENLKTIIQVPNHPMHAASLTEGELEDVVSFILSLH